MARIRMIFSKRGRSCFVPHVEMPPLFCRALRRIGTSIEQTAGMVPHARISLGPALPVGVPAMAEPLEVWIDNWDPGMVVLLNSSLPDGVRVIAGGVAEGLPKLSDQCEAALYRIYPRGKDVLQRLSDMTEQGWEPVRNIRFLSFSPMWFDLAVGDPGQVGAGTLVKSLVKEGVIDSWKDLLVARLAVGLWTGRGVRTLPCTGKGTS
ncbi:MAG TPA: DUF2344 domain-containing protein [Synergistales bacterium]|jgi:hypothetical protein|nr:DUF2344 domain-containing protein [Synergistales bacterium]